MILKSLEKYFISSFHWCGHLCLSCVCGGDTWTPHPFFSDACGRCSQCICRVKFAETQIWSHLYLAQKLSVASDSSKSSALAVGVQRAPRSSLFPLPSSVPPIHSQPTTGSPHPHRLLRVLRVGLFLILPASACSNLARPSHLCSDVTTAIRPSYLCRNRIPAPLSLAAPSPPALVATGMFSSVLLVFEDIFLLFRFGFPAPRISCAFHTGGLTSREKASPALTLPSEHLASLLLLLHVHLEGFADVCRDGGHTQTSIWFL